MINFVSAQGFSEFLDQIDQSTLILGAIFIISFSILFFSLSKILLKDNPTIAGIISVALALLLTYTANKSDFNFGDFFYNIGISGESLSLILTLVILAGIIFMMARFEKKENVFLVLGGVLLVASLFVYTKIILVFIGIIFLIIWIFIKSKKNKNSSGKLKKYFRRYRK